jgi:uncharacterized protein (DUF1501 family)
MCQPSPMQTNKRYFLQTAAALGASAFMPRVWAQKAPAGAPKDAGRMIVVFLRGAYDGLSAFMPTSDQDYYAIRPNISIAPPDGTDVTALKLGDHLGASWGMHPALLPLLPLWQQGALAVVPAAGLPKPNRSHFDAQYLMEIGLPEKTGVPLGWMNKLAAQMPSAATAAMGVGEANPAILAGATPVRLIPRGEAAARTGVLANERNKAALMDLYAGDDAISQAFRQGVASRVQTSQELTAQRQTTQRQREQSMTSAPKANPLDKDGTPQNTAAQVAQMQAASNGAADPVGLALDAQHLATLMNNDRRLRLGFLSAGGWDTHANQGNITGQLANNLGNLARGIAQLRQQFSERGDVIVVMSEFGRTSAENGTRGTDHGFGNALWLIGQNVQGGRMHGQWTGLARTNLNEARDLPAHHDYRAVLAQTMRRTFALPDSQLQTLLPGASWDTRLDGLFQKT